MKKEQFDFMGELLKRIIAAYNAYGKDCDIQMEYHSNKDYWTINIKLIYCNSKYEDCVVMYLNEDSFEPEEILSDFDKIISKARIIFER